MRGDVCYERTFVALKRRQALELFEVARRQVDLRHQIRANRTDAQQFQLRSATSVAHICSALNLSTNREARLRVTFFTGTEHGLGYPFDNCLCFREVRNARHSQSYFTRNWR